MFLGAAAKNGNLGPRVELYWPIFPVAIPRAACATCSTLAAGFTGLRAVVVLSRRCCDTSPIPRTILVDVFIEKDNGLRMNDLGETRIKKRMYAET